MNDLMDKRNRIIDGYEKIRNTQVKPDENNPEYEALERELASLYPTLSKTLVTLKSDELVYGKTFGGYLDCVAAPRYVSVDSDYKWLSGNNGSDYDDYTSVWWDLYLDGVGSAVFKTNVKPGIRYLNYRAITGCCKLYDTYEKINLTWSTTETFTMYVPYHEQYIGTWSKSDYDLYLRGDSENRDFKFKVYDLNLMSEQDKLIYNAFLKQKEVLPLHEKANY